MNKIVLVILILFQSVINAQKDSIKVIGELGIRGKWQTGNFAQFVINPNAKIVVSKKRTRIEARANYEFLKVNKGSLINDFWSFGMYQYNSNKNVFPMAMVHYGFAQSYAIDHSFVGGVGAGTNIVKKEEHKYFQANVFAGYMNLKYEGSEVHGAPNAGTYIKLKFPLKKNFVHFIVDINGYISLDDMQYRGFNNRVIVNFQVLKNLGINTSHRLVYNHNTISGINETNGNLVFGLNYIFH